MIGREITPVDVALLTGYDEGPFYYFVHKREGTNWTIEEAAEHLGLRTELT